MGINNEFIELQLKLDKEAGKKATFYKDENGRDVIYVHISNLATELEKLRIEYEQYKSQKEEENYRNGKWESPLTYLEWLSSKEVK